MRILYDSVYIADGQKIGGVSRYFSEIIPRLQKEHEPLLGFSQTKNVYFKEMGVPEYRKNILERITWPGRWRPQRKKISLSLAILTGGLFFDAEFENREMTKQLLAAGDFDVWHFTGLVYDVVLEFNRKKRPLVITVHDLTPERFGGSRARLAQRKRLAMRASRIIAVSNTTKNDIIAFWGIPEDMIDVIYHAPTIGTVDTGYASQYGKYLLYVGGRNGYKNFNFFVCSISNWLHDHPEVKIVCTGAGFSPKELALFREKDLESRFISVFVDDKDFYSFFHHAIAFIYPSRYEGFGIPIVDAFFAECPVILSDTSCFPEVAGDAGLFFNPENREELVAAVERVYSDSFFRHELISKGINRVLSFSWDVSAQKTLSTYQTAINGY